MSVRPSATERVGFAAEQLGLSIDIVTMAQSTRTAEDAAAACGCHVGQIVKSLVFQRRDTELPVLLLVSGSNRVDTTRVASTIGAKLTRPDADFVRLHTGYAIGGIPPFGHDTQLATYFDRTLFDHPIVWAAAGTPLAVFAISPATLQSATAATVLDVV